MSIFGLKYATRLEGEENIEPDVLESPADRFEIRSLLLAMREHGVRPEKQMDFVHSVLGNYKPMIDLTPRDLQTIYAKLVSK